MASMCAASFGSANLVQGLFYYRANCLQLQFRELPSKINFFRLSVNSGNRIEQLGTPYKRGRPCSGCQQSCHSKKIRYERLREVLIEWILILVAFRLCVNSCHAADLWANCRELHKTWPDWLCRTNTTEGLQRQQNCLATCNCQGKIHD